MTPDDIVALWREHKEVHAFARAVEAIAKADEREATAKRCAEIADKAEPYQAADLIRKAFGVDPMPLFDDWGMK